MKHPRSFIDYPVSSSVESSDHRPSRRTSFCRSLALGGAVLLVVQTLSAATLTFGSNADYDNNFYEVFNGSLIARDTTNNNLSKTSSGAATAVYNTHATGGSGGSGGTAGGLPLDKFADFTVQASYSSQYVVTSLNGFGFYTKINDAGTTGYAALFRITSATTVDFRLFESNGTLSNSGVGAQIGTTQTITGPANSFFANTFYNFRLTVTDVGSDVQFDASVWNTAGTAQIGVTRSIVDTSSAVTGLGQVGFRIGEVGRVDNFAITAAAIPEPGTSALFASGAALLLAGLRRRKRSSR